MKVNITDILPHRKPFLFIDEVIDCSYHNYSKAIKRVKADEFWVEGHFPGNPVYPGVLLLESMAQTGGFVFVDEEGHSAKTAYLSKVDNLKYINKVQIGDEIVIEAKFIEAFLNYAKVHVKATVNNKVVSKCEIVYTFMDQL